jgi:hypothetical protein
MLLAFMLASPPSSATSPVFIKVEGRNLVAVSEINEYVVTALGGPAELGGGNYTFLITVGGEGAADAIVLPSNGNSTTGIFRFNLTAASIVTEMALRINATSVGSDGDKAYAEYVYHVRSITPIVVSATVVNQGSMDLSGVTVDIYVDDQKMAQRTISVEAGSSRVVTYNWTESVAAGKHEVRMELDPGNQYVRFGSGETVYTQAFWTGGNDYGNTDAILIGLIIVLVFMAYIIYKRPAAKRRKSK